MLIVIDIHIYGFAWIYNVYIYIYMSLYENFMICYESVSFIDQYGFV